MEEETTGERLQRELAKRAPLARPEADTSAVELKPEAKPATVTNETAATGALPLKNRKHEMFCEIVTGWGGAGEPMFAYKAYMSVYPATEERSAKANAARLAARPDIRARIDYLRGQLCAATLLDKTALRRDIFEKRSALIEWGLTHKYKGGAAIALNALRDQEKAQGLDAPEVTRTVEDEATGKVEKSNVLSGLMQSLQRVVKTTRHE